MTEPPPVFPLVFTPHAPRAVVQARGVERPEAFLRGAVTTLAPSAETPAHLALDFGEELVGVLDLHLATEAATTIELVYGEDLDEALMPADPFPPEHWYHQPRDVIELPAGAEHARHSGRRAFRYVSLVVRGPGRVRLRGARMMLEHAPASDRGWFSCSDALLNDAWRISRRTTRLCMQGFYEDGVKRDGMLWIGDYRVEFLCAHLLFGDAAVARRSLEMIARCRHPDGSLSAVALLAGGHLHPRIHYLGDLTKPGGLHHWVLDNYCADFVCGVWEYVLHTGDISLAGTLAPVVRGVLGYLASVDPVRADCPAKFITDNRTDESAWWGSRSTLAFQIAAAFDSGARLARLEGDDARARECAGAHRERVRRAAGLFGEPGRAACRDDADPGAPRSWHAHAAAFLAGGLSPAGLRAVYPLLNADSSVRRPVAGFMEFHLLRAWLGAGLVGEALGEMRAYWGQMLRNGATTTWELVDRRLPGLDRLVVAGRSHCHGWSAGPAYLLPAHILGVTPASPGYRAVDIRPALGDLDWAEGEIPTPQGEVRVSLSAPGAGEVTLPDGVTATLHLPGRAPAALAGGRTHGFRWDENQIQGE